MKYYSYQMLVDGRWTGDAWVNRRLSREDADKMMAAHVEHPDGPISDVRVVEQETDASRLTAPVVIQSEDDDVKLRAANAMVNGLEKLGVVCVDCKLESIESQIVLTFAQKEEEQ